MMNFFTQFMNTISIYPTEGRFQFITYTAQKMKFSIKDFFS